MRHSRIVNEQVMGEVKNSVTDKSNNDHPKISPETDHRSQKKPASNREFECQCPPGGAHQRKQHIIRRDYDEHGGIKGAVAVKTDADGQSGNRQGQSCPYKIFHALSPVR